MHSLKKYLLSTALIAIIGSAGYWYTQEASACSSGIFDFQEERDLLPMLEIFEQDKFWLTSNPDSRPDIMFSQRTPDIYKPEMYGKMHIKVAWDGNRIVGFTTFYKKNFYEGKILFLEVQADFRKHGWGQKLLECAFNTLRSWGLKKVNIVTRPSNDRALRLYNRVGFKETKRNEDYVWLSRPL